MFCADIFVLPALLPDFIAIKSQPCTFFIKKINVIFQQT
uniref:Uncharacterized protein n=1 Tax=Ciona intestinalis TaxID=7719 RepID=F7BBZ4_CIOIN